MYISILSGVGCLTFSFILNLCVDSQAYASTRSLDKPCQKVETIFARGSGEKLEDLTYKRFRDQIDRRLVGSNLKPEFYELGTDKYDGHQYPAIEVTSNFYFNAGQAQLYNSVSALDASNYGKSMNDGISEFKSYFSQRYAKCQSSGTYYILSGYSQGAQVIGQSLGGIPSNMRDRILFVGLFGDPKLYFPEGKWGDWGFLTPPPACQGKQLSLYRRVIGDCQLYTGSLGGRIKYLPEDMNTKTGSWCYARDLICGTSHNLFINDGHETYKNPGLAVDSAAQEAVARLKIALELDQRDHPSSPSPSPTPSSSPSPSPTPTPEDLFQLIDTTHHFEQGTSGEDIVIAIDRERSMAPYASQISNFVHSTATKLAQRGGRFAIVFYSGYSYPTPSIGSAATRLDTPDMSLYILDQQLPWIFDGTYPGSPLDAAYTAFGQANWRVGATKSIIFLTNKKTFDSPDLKGNTIASITKRSLEIDPVNIYPVVPADATGAFQELADKTSGQVVMYDGTNFEAAANLALTKTEQRPVVFLKLSQYIANPGQEITFDASDSYALDSTITKYEWDFDGDGNFDQTTTTPSADHTYTSTFDGTMQVRLTAANGTIANGSATVKVGTYVAPVLPKAPLIKTTVLSTINNVSTVRLSWTANDILANKWAIGVNGVILGTATADRNSIDITDVDRSIDTDFSVTGMIDDETIGETAVTTLMIPTKTVTQSQNATNDSKTTPNIVAVDNDNELNSPTSIQQFDNLKRQFGSKVKSTKDKTNHSHFTNAYVWTGASLVFAGGSWRLFKRIRRSR